MIESGKQAEAKDKDMNDKDAKLSNRPRWNDMSREELVAYIMFDKEYPWIKVKPLKVQPIKQNKGNS